LVFRVRVAGDNAQDPRRDQVGERDESVAACRDEALGPGKISLTQSVSASGRMPVATAPGQLTRAQLHQMNGLAPTAGRPDRNTLTQLLSSARPGPTPGASWGAPTHRPPPRVADAQQDEAKLNAVLKVIVIDDGKVIQRWQSKARWAGPLPVRWAAMRAGGQWKWDNPDGRSLKVQTDARGGGGKLVEAWAKRSADRIVVHVQAIGDVKPTSRLPMQRLGTLQPLSITLGTTARSSEGCISSHAIFTKQ
jgi:hypothetical protein